MSSDEPITDIEKLGEAIRDVGAAFEVALEPLRQVIAGIMPVFVAFLRKMNRSVGKKKDRK